MRKRFSVEQIVAIVKQAEMAMPVAELIRWLGSASRYSTAGKSSSPGVADTKLPVFDLGNVSTPVSQFHLGPEPLLLDGVFVAHYWPFSVAVLVSPLDNFRTGLPHGTYVLCVSKIRKDLSGNELYCSPNSRILSFDAHFPARTSHHTGFDPSFAP
jgi:hypothetical protein